MIWCVLNSVEVTDMGLQTFPCIYPTILCIYRNVLLNTCVPVL